MKRVFLFLLTNLAVIVLLDIVCTVLGVNRFLTPRGLDVQMLLVFAAIFGFGGSFISLLLSKVIAKWSTGARVISTPQTPLESWLVQTVHALAQRANLKAPEVAIYEGAPNAFATGAFRNSALVAVSTGLLESMNRDEVEAVLGHEMSHIANGDMVTLGLLQGVVNTFVIFLSNLIAWAIDNALRRDSDEGGGLGQIGYFVTRIVLEMSFGLVGSMIVMWYSRQREFRADAGSARLLGSGRPMISALTRLGSLSGEALPQHIEAMGIASGKGMFSLFASHPPLADRIRALQQATAH